LALRLKPSKPCKLFPPRSDAVEVQVQVQGFWVLGFGVRGWSFGFGFQGSGFRVSGLGLRVSDFRLQASGVRSRVSGFGLRASGFGRRISSFGVGISSFRLWVSGSRFRGWGFEFQVSAFGLRASGFWFRVPAFGFRVKALPMNDWRTGRPPAGRSGSLDISAPSTPLADCTFPPLPQPLFLLGRISLSRSPSLSRVSRISQVWGLLPMNDWRTGRPAGRSGSLGAIRPPRTTAPVTPHAAGFLRGTSATARRRRGVGAFLAVLSLLTTPLSGYVVTSIFM